MLYRIRWISKVTGKSGFGTKLFSKNEADTIVRFMNEDKSDPHIHHEVVLVDEEQKDSLSK